MKFSNHTLAPLYLGSGTWATLIATYANGSGAQAALPVHTLYLATDIGKNPCWLTLNAAKTRWVPVNGQHGLARYAGSYASPVVTLSATGQFGLPGGSPSIPGGVLGPGDCISVQGLVRKRNANATAGIVWRMGTVGTYSSDAQIGAITLSNATPRDLFVTLLAFIGSSATTFSTSGTTLPGNQANGSAADSTTNVDHTSLQYLNIDCNSISASDFLDIVGMEWTWRAQ